MTVQWQGPAWLRRPAEVLGLGSACRRATSLTLEGPRFNELTLERVAHLKHLRTLDLYGTTISDRAISALQKSLPDCRIQRDPPTAEAVDWANLGAVFIAK